MHSIRHMEDSTFESIEFDEFDLGRPKPGALPAWYSTSLRLVEHCSANAEATGSNPVEAPKSFFSFFFRNCLNCDSLRWPHTHFICIPAVHIISFCVTQMYILAVSREAIKIRDRAPLIESLQ